MTIMFDSPDEELEILNGFTAGRRYEEILNTMREVKNVGESNKEYVKSLISMSETELRKMTENYGERLTRDGDNELDRLTKLLNNQN